jgi:hypothetical protein
MELPLKVRLDNEGPLDLLLYLIKKNKSTSMTSLSRYYRVPGIPGNDEEPQPGRGRRISPHGRHAALSNRRCSAATEGGREKRREDWASWSADCWSTSLGRRRSSSSGTPLDQEVFVRSFFGKPWQKEAEGPSRKVTLFDLLEVMKKSGRTSREGSEISVDTSTSG